MHRNNSSSFHLKISSHLIQNHNIMNKSSYKLIIIDSSIIAQCINHKYSEYQNMQQNSKFSSNQLHELSVSFFPSFCSCSAVLRFCSLVVFKKSATFSWREVLADSTWSRAEFKLSSSLSSERKSIEKVELI